MSLSGGVVGFDFGTVNCVISQAKRGGIDTVLNEASKRKTRCYVSFQGNQRFIGDAAVPLSKSNYKNTIRYVKRLLGRRWSDPAAQEEIKMLPNSDRAVELENGDIGITVTYNDAEVTFSCEQLVAMMMNRLRATVNKKQPPEDVVVSVPGWWNEKQRRSLLTACKIAGFTPLRLLNDHTAAALSYGIYKSARNVFDVSERQIVMFIDVGYSNMSVAIVGFIQGKLEVLSVAFDPNLGGRDFDIEIFNKLAAEFKQKHNLDVTTNQKSVLKLMEACEKAKQTLTPEGVNLAKVTVEFLMNEIDFRSELKLDDFETMSQGLLQRMKVPIENALKLANMKVSDVGSVEIIGGGTRPKIVKKALASYMNLDLEKLNYGLSTTLNLDEAVARGCALNSAMLSPTFRVKEFNIYDTVNVPVTLTWDQAETLVPGGVEDEEDMGEANPTTTNSVTILQRAQSSPCTKRVTFRRSKDFDIFAKYEVNDEVRPTCCLPSTFDNNLATFKVRVDGVTPPKGAIADKIPLIRVDFCHDINGVFQLVGAESLHELEAVPEKPTPAKEAEKPAGSEEKDAKTDEGNGADSSKDAQAESGEKKMEEENQAKKEAKSGEEAKEEAKQPVKKKYKKVKLKVDKTYLYELSQQLVQKYLDLEVGYSTNDKKIEETAEARNELETFIYSSRDKVDLSLREFLTPEEKENFSTKLSEQESWLYDEGFDETKEEYQKRFEQLKLLGDRFEKRLAEWDARPVAERDLKDLARRFNEVINSTDEVYDHITEEERTKVRAKIKETEEWLEHQLHGQNKLSKHDDPVLTSRMIREQLIKLNTVGHPIVTKPKPLPKKVDPPPAKEGGEDSSKAETMEEDKASGEGDAEEKKANGAKATENGTVDEASMDVD